MNVPVVSSRATLPRVDVIVPCYRYGHLLDDCIGSVLAQSGVEVRAVIIDDASPDGSADVAARLAAAHSRVEVVHHDRNLGHIATFNHGLSLVDGEFVVLLSADDRLTRGALARAVTTMRRRPDVGFVYGRARRFGDRWHEPVNLPLGTGVWRGDHWVRDRCRQAVNVISAPEVVVRTSVHRQVGGYEATLPHTADLHLWLRLASVADVAYLRGRNQAGYRVHPDSLQRTVHAGALIDVTERVVMFRHLGQHAWNTRPDRDDLLQVAFDALARETTERTRRLRERGLNDEADHLEASVRQVWPPDHDLPPTVAARTPVLALCAGMRRRVRRQYRSWRWEVLGS